MGFSPTKCLLPSRRKTRDDEEQIQKEGSLCSYTSPLLSYLTRHSEFSCYEEDLWIEVAKRLDGRDLIRLAVTNRWFYRLIMEDSIWKYACLRDLQVLSPHHVSFKWFQLYASAFDWKRIGAILFETPSAVLTDKLALLSKLMELEEDHKRAIQLSGTCILTDIRTGIWIVDMHIDCCPACSLNNNYKGTTYILDMRHLELFLEGSFRNRRWQFENIGSHRIEEES